MKYKIIFFIYLLAMEQLLVPTAQANTIEKIQHKRRAEGNRLVVEFDQKTDYKTHWNNNHSFSVVFSPLQFNKEAVLPGDAKKIGAFLQRNSSGYTLNLPISPEQLTHVFAVTEKGKGTYQVVIDWLDKKYVQNKKVENSEQGLISDIEEIRAVHYQGFRLNFIEPVQFISMVPREKSKQFQLRLRSLIKHSNSFKRTVLTWQPSLEMPLKSVELQTEPTGDFIANISFADSVTLQTFQGKTLRNLEFRILREKSAVEPGELLWKKAKKALAEGRYDRAILLMSQLRKIGNIKQKKLAQEFIGVARERKGQLAFARDEYKRFLKQYPDTQEARRVQQRLDALIGLETLAKDRKLKKRTGSRRKNSRGWSNYGSLSSDYRYTGTVDNNGNYRNSLSLLNVDADVTGRYRNQDYEFQLRFSGGHYEDLLPSARGTTQRLRYLYINAQTADNHYKSRLGRQRSHKGGVIGRFDGLLLSAKPFEHFGINLVSGFPVDSSRITSIDTERVFYGLSMDFDNIFKDFELNLFALQQDIKGGLIDRQAIGGEARYVSGNHSYFSLLDYDTHFKSLNAFLVNGNHRFENKTRVNWSVNIRKSPYLSTRNALIGQAADSIQELQLLFVTDTEIQDLAIDRTLESKSASVTVSTPYSDDIDISGSLTWLNLSAAPASGGVPAFASSGSQYYLNLQVTGHKVITSKDTSYLGMRYSSLSNSKIFSIYGNSRLPWGERSYFNPKLRFDYRNNTNGSSQFNVSPSIRFQYQQKRHIFYVEGGMIYFVTDLPNFKSQNTTIYYSYLGYRFSF